MRDSVEFAVSFTPAIRARQLARIDRALRSPGEMTAETTALTHVLVRGMEAQASIVRELDLIDSQRDHQRSAIEDEYASLLRRYNRTEHGAEASSFPALPDEYPQDKATRWALTILRMSDRCHMCGQYKGAEGTHACPPRGRSRVARAAQTTQGTATQTEPSAQPASEPFTSAVAAPQLQPWDIDDFQEDYDTARVLLDNDPLHGAPTDLAVEMIPGGVTAGLGSRDGGISFGLELEIDFPNDTPRRNGLYPMRTEFARRLHEEGITSHNEVMGWHHRRADGEPRAQETYQESADDWICEYDRSVDDVQGARGVEIKSQILYDEPRTWANIRKILEISEELGGEATSRTGMHVNIGAQKISPADPEPVRKLLEISSAYDDTIVRVGNNPAAGSADHRGRTYCQPISSSQHGFIMTNVSQGIRNEEMHRHIMNVSHLASSRHLTQKKESRIEGRGFDGVAKASDIGRIQAAVTLHLAIAEASVQGLDAGQPAQPAGTNREKFGRRRLSGTDWAESTLPVRNLTRLVEQATAGGSNPLFRRQISHLFAQSRWQQN